MSLQFRPIINRVLATYKISKADPPFDHVLLLRIIILQNIYNLSDDNTENQINDRFSFMRFLVLNISYNVPDEKTIWKFKITLRISDLFREKIQAEMTETDLV